MKIWVTILRTSGRGKKKKKRKENMCIANFVGVRTLFDSFSAQISLLVVIN